ncbi:MAG: amidohydrolase family protein [Planctomycetota bacterium]
MIVDAHHHLWDPARGDYDWMPKDVAVLNRVYGPADMAPELEAVGVEKTVLVQAAATVAETDYMLALADATDWIGAVVGWVDFEDPSERQTLERLSAHPKFRGVRPMIQDLPDRDWMLRDDIQWAFEVLMELDLSFDMLGLPEHLTNTHTLMTRYPDLRTVYDHCMKPQIREAREGGDPFPAWAEGMARLARDTSGMCKLSGLATEAGREWSLADLRPYAQHVLDVFGPSRVMWGSDWPVCRFAAEYQVWWSAAQELTEGLSQEERGAVFGGNAAQFYRI